MIVKGDVVEKLAAARMTLFILDKKHRQAWTHKVSIDRMIEDLDYYIATAELRSASHLQDIWRVTSDILDAQDVQIYSLRKRA